MGIVSFDPLWKTLVDHHMNKMELKEVAGLSKGTITKMVKNESITVDVLTRICNALDCDGNDVLEIKEHGERA